MSCPARYAVLMDGAFVIRKLESRLRRFPTALEIQSVADAISRHEFVAGSADVIVTVTGDSDLVPAFKFARREGLRVFLCHLGHAIKRQLHAHADRTMRVNLPEAATEHPAHKEAA